MHLPWHLIAPGPGLEPVSTSVLPAEARRLASLAGSAGPVLEIGSAYGYSAVVMALAGARVTAVDPHTWIPGSQAVMRGHLAAAGLEDRVEIIAEPSGAVMPRLAPASFGMVFVDGDHSAAAVEADVTAAVPLLAPGGILACHDYGEDCCCPGVRAVLDRLYPRSGNVTGTLWVMTV